MRKIHARQNLIFDVAKSISRNSYLPLSQEFYRSHNLEKYQLEIVKRLSFMVAEDMEDKAKKTNNQDFNNFILAEKECKKGDEKKRIA